MSRNCDIKDQNDMTKQTTSQRSNFRFKEEKTETLPHKALKYESNNSKRKFAESYDVIQTVCGW